MKTRVDWATYDPTTAPVRTVEDRGLALRLTVRDLPSNYIRWVEQQDPAAQEELAETLISHAETLDGQEVYLGDRPMSEQIEATRIAFEGLNRGNSRRR